MATTTDISGQFDDADEFEETQAADQFVPVPRPHTLLSMTDTDGQFSNAEKFEVSTASDSVKSTRDQVFPPKPDTAKQLVEQTTEEDFPPKSKNAVQYLTTAPDGTPPSKEVNTVLPKDIKDTCTSPPGAARTNVPEIEHKFS